ncbi:hypothetical protein ACFL5O_11580, partial [Myxococcota bacterium]
LLSRKHAREETIRTEPFFAHRYPGETPGLPPARKCASSGTGGELRGTEQGARWATGECVGGSEGRGESRHSLRTSSV